LLAQTTPSNYKFIVLYTKRKFSFHTYGTTQNEGVRTKDDEENIWAKECGSEKWIEIEFNEKLHNVSARH
jgi:hypothetical protein